MHGVRGGIAGCAGVEHQHSKAGSAEHERRVEPGRTRAHNDHVERCRARSSYRGTPLAARGAGGRDIAADGDGGDMLRRRGPAVSYMRNATTTPDAAVTAATNQ